MGVSGEDSPMTPSGDSIATYDHREFPAAVLAEMKGGHRLSVCIPARDEAATIGPIVAAIADELLGGLVDELVVVDDGSRDATAAIAERYGALVVPSEPPTGGAPTSRGKGEAMQAGLDATSGDLVVFLDGDVTNFASFFVSGLVGPLLLRPSVMLVKGRYLRPLDGAPTGGGRVTELVARPLLSLLFPELIGVAQPLAGETAVRRAALDGIELSTGYGVEIALLIDLAERFGPAGLAQVDLGIRSHRNRPLEALAPQARAVLAAALARAGIPAQ
jgi:glucosyl-3-phosphoglycerate synthase